MRSTGVKSGMLLALVCATAPIRGILGQTAVLEGIGSAMTIAVRITRCASVMCLESLACRSNVA